MNTSKSEYLCPLTKGITRGLYLIIGIIAFCGGALSASAKGLTGGVEFECTSAFVFNGMIYNDRPMASYAPFLEYYVTDDFWVGGYFWQLYDLTDRRRHTGIRGEWNETDFDVYVGANLWKSQDEAYVLRGNLHWYWETDVIRRRWVNMMDYPYATLEFKTPWITPFVGALYDIRHYHTLTLIPGAKHDFKLTDSLSLEAKVLAYGGHTRTMQNVFYSPNGKTGIASMEGRLTLKWQVTEWMQVGTYVALLANVNSRIQHDWHMYSDYIPSYYRHEQLVYGGITASIGF